VAGRPGASPSGCGLLLDGLPQGGNAPFSLAEHLSGALTGILPATR